LRLAAGESAAEEMRRIRELLAAVAREDVPALRAALRAGALGGRVASAAPAVTAAAQHGMPLAQAVCDATADSLLRGARLLISEFGGRAVEITPDRSVAYRPVCGPPSGGWRRATRTAGGRSPAIRRSWARRSSPCAPWA
jgi:hypothetical protein